MSMEPIQRRMQNPAAGAINVPVNLTDQVTTLTFIQLGQNNTILDMYNAVDPAGTATYEYGLDKNSISTGRTFFSNAMSTASAGRAAVGPLRINQGQLQMTGTPTTALAPIGDQNIVIKFSNGF